MADDLREKIAEVLAGHRDVIGRKVVRCECGDWAFAYEVLGITEVAAEHRRHVAEAILATIGDRVAPHRGEAMSEIIGVRVDNTSANGLPYARITVKGMSGVHAPPAWAVLAHGAVPWHASAWMREIAGELLEKADHLDRDWPRANYQSEES